MDAFDAGYRRYKFLRRQALRAATAAAADKDKDRDRDDAVDNSVANMGSRYVSRTAMNPPTPPSKPSPAPLHKSDVLGTWSACWS